MTRKSKSVKNHENKYWHIPKFKIRLLALFLLSIAITIGYSFIFIEVWKLHSISSIFSCVDVECIQIPFSSLGFIPHIFFAYFLISSIFITLAALIKGGFNKLKSYYEGGLIYGLMVCLIFGLICGLIDGSIFGLIYGLIVGLIASLIYGSIFGLILEFEREQEE